MKSSLKLFARWWLYSHLFIGFCAAAMTWLSFYLLGIPVAFNTPEILLAGSGATIVYILHRHLGMMRFEEMKLPGRYRHILHLWPTTIAVFLLACIGLIYSLWMLPRKDLFLLSMPFILTLGYLVPLYNSKRFRDIPFLKIILVALVWTWVTLIFPLMRYEMVPGSWVIPLMIVERALFIFAITIPFDIRDMEQDLLSRTKTIPSTFHIKSSKLMAGIALCVALIIDAVLAGYYGFYTPGSLMGFLLTYVLSLFLIFNSSPDKPDWYYTGLVDGTMLLLPLAIFLGDKLIR